ncbi:MAG: KpsF/GutQ family sugar-phosphate isomerase [Gammaproteobacteria bacterium]|nr:KpsF/GutQ family sugar-phosphate isomerase [Gammaproteobacteria bacterium]MCH9762755.1 KpsF/GutQ family sugar-phosphate isomerase [Gammaproteobacteria bacterium]
MDFCQSGLAVIETEGAAVLKLTQQINHEFEKACALLFSCEGRIIVTGMGKSGHIGKKIAATFASTGSPAFFVHPAEANHGDLGMVTPKDMIIAISNSGKTNEIISLLPHFKRLDVPIISLTGNPDSTLAKIANINLNLQITAEACPLNLAPTTSTTLALVMGDALAIALLNARGFTAEDFAKAHPGGALGQKLLLTAEDVYQTDIALPLINENASIHDAVAEVNSKQLGLTCVVDTNNCLTGIYTDGDIRRSLMESHDIHTTPIQDVMTKNCKTISKQALAAEALALMQKHSITSLVITNPEQQPIAILHIHDLLRAGVI